MRFSVSCIRPALLCATCAAALIFPATLPAQTAPGVPDVVGLRAGDSAQQAYNALKTWGHGSKIGIGMMQLPISQKPVAVIMSTQLLNTSPTETMTVWLTLPPQNQVVWAIRHEVTYDPDKQLLTSTPLQALRQKYGPEMDPRNHSWFFDEQGKPVDAAGPGKGNCNDIGLVIPSNVGPDLTAPIASSPLITIGDPRYTVCNQIIKVNARLVGTPGKEQLTQVITVVLQDMALGHRNQVAYQAALANAGAAQEKEKLDRAGQEKAPAF